LESKPRSIKVVPAQAVEDLFTTLAALPPLTHCRRRGFELLHLDATFFSENEKVWTLQLSCLPEL
jgi:hypothetical protein